MPERSIGSRGAGRGSAARNAFVVTSVAVLTVGGFVALWKLKGSSRCSSSAS